MKIYYSGFDKDLIVLKENIKSLFRTTTKLLNKNDNFGVSISIVNEIEIQNLNKKHRNIDKITDVLSFPLIEDFDNIDSEAEPETGLIDLGDIVICLQRAKEQALEYGHSLKREVCFLCVHGFLHLFGYDHMSDDEEKKMFELQETILNKNDIGR